MNRRTHIRSFLIFYLFTFAGLLILTMAGSRAITALAENAQVSPRRCIIIDAGHGGEDGGAVSISGVYESNINLEISLRLDDLLHLLGYDTKMIRTEDISIYTAGKSLSQKKISDLKERVRIINETDNAILISIHQNHFTESKYHGGQVFYAKTSKSQELAKKLQENFTATVNEGSNRQCKQSSGIYLMENIHCTGVLIECGFLSNPEEEYLLRSDRYQRKLCCVIAASISQFLDY